MKSKMLIPIFLFAAGIAAAQNSNLTSLLQKGLLEEQANGNLDAAIADYRSLAGEFDKSRQVAATAVFRLGECYRAQGKTNEAVAQYRRVLSEFSDQATLATLSWQDLVGLGAPPAEAAASAATPGAGGGAVETLQNQFDLLKAQLAMARSETNNQLMIAELFNRDGPELAERLRQTIYASMQNPADQQIAQSVKDARQQLLDYEEMRLKILQSAIAQARPGQSSPVQSGNEPVAEENDEDHVIRGIQRMIQDSPDLINAGQLGEAANRGQLRVARFLLDHGADVNATYNGTLPINMAVKNAQKAMVELLLSRGADVNAHDNHGIGGGNTPLMTATSYGFQAVVEVLLAHGADVNEISITTTPLHRAVDKGYLNLVKALLAAGANPNSQDAGGVTPLSYAAGGGSIEILKLLLAAKADPNGGRLNAPLFSAINGSHDDAAELLLEAGANPNAMGTVTADVTVRERHYAGAPVEVTPLFLAAAKGELPMVRLLLKHKADPNDSRTEKRPLLFVTLFDTNILDALLGAGANTEVLGWSGQMPAPSYSANNMHMLERPGPLQYQWRLDGTEPANNQTALEAAVGQNNPGAVEVLLRHGANPNAHTPGDETPLHWAAFLPADEKVFKLLLDAGADPNVRDRSGRTPVERVRANLRETQIPEQVRDISAIIDLLHAYGALDNLPNWDNIQMVPASGSAETVFLKSTNDWNRFTLLEAVLDYFTTAGNTYSSADTKRPLPKSYVFDQPFPGSVPLPFPRTRETAMPFPDLTRVVIVRPRQGSTNVTRINVNLLNATNDIDCLKDVPLEFGDMVELAQCDHPLSATAWWLSDGQVSTIINYLHGTAQLIVRGQTTPLPLDPWGDRSFIGLVLHQQAARQVLLASSDLSRVKVTRHNPKTGKVTEWTLNCSNPSWPDLWLRDGDVIEVPEK